MRAIVPFVFSLLCATGVASAKTYDLSSKLSCEARAQVVNRLAAGTRLTLPKRQVEIGDTLALKWARGRFPEREPVFLMVSVDQPVRAEGDGFYVLNPGATAPFEISWAKDKTRIVVPYYGRGAPKSGGFKLRPLQVGALGLEWRVVGHSGCAEVLAQANDPMALNVTASGRPRIVVSDPESVTAPKKRYLSADGSRRLDILSDSFRLIDVASGSEIMDGAGTEAVFSPTGRFVHIPRGQNMGIYDAVDGAQITDNVSDVNPYGGTLLWANHDSFVISTHNAYGVAAVDNPLGGKGWGQITDGCRGCSGMHTAKIGVDLENNVILARDYAFATAVSLTNDRRTKLKAKSRLTAAQIQATLDWSLKNTGVMKPTLPVWREIKGGLTFQTGFMSAPHSRKWHEGQTHWNDLRQVPIFNQIEVATSDQTDTTTARLTTVKSNWRTRGLARDATFVTTSQMMTRLGEFGIKLLEPIKVERAPIPVYPPRSASETERAQARQAIETAHADIVRRISHDTGADIASFSPIHHGNCGYGPTFVANPGSAWHWQRHGITYWLTTTSCSEGLASFLYPKTEFFSSKAGGQFKFAFDAYDGDTFDNPTTDNGVNCLSSVDACGFELSVMGDLMLMSSPEGKAFALYDYVQNRMVLKRFNVPRGDVFQNALLLEGGAHILTLQSDGSFFIFEITSGKEVLQGRYADDEVVVWTPDGRFDATAEGAHFVAFTFPGRPGEYAFQLFEDALKRPGLLDMALAGSMPAAGGSISPPPNLTADLVVEDGMLKISAEASGSAPITSLRVFQDGLLTDQITPEQTTGTARWDISVPQRSGTRWVSLVAEDAKKVVSLPLETEVQVTGNRQIHVLSIGVDLYDRSLTDAVPNLSSAVSDATLVAETLSGLQAKGQVIPQPVVLTNHAATPQRMLEEIGRSVEKAKPGDTLAIFFAGHGVAGPDGAFYLAPSSLDASDIPGTGLAFSDISALLRQARDVRIVLFLDACHSGLAGQGLFTTNDDITESALAAVPSGLVVFSAAKGREFALESLTAGGGLFATSLADVIGAKRSAHDLNGNGTIEASELFLGVKGNVIRQVNALSQQAGSGVRTQRQTPWMARNRMIGDFALF